jgi:hypothetical protein
LCLDESPVAQSLRDAMALAHRNVFRIGPRNWQALAWEISGKKPAIIEKYGARGLRCSLTRRPPQSMRRLCVGVAPQAR